MIYRHWWINLFVLCSVPIWSSKKNIVWVAHGWGLALTELVLRSRLMEVATLAACCCFLAVLCRPALTDRTCKLSASWRIHTQRQRVRSATEKIVPTSQPLHMIHVLCMVHGLQFAGRGVPFSSFPVGVPECSNIAFVNEDKFLTCPASSSTVLPDSGCEGYNASSVQSLGGTIRWCILVSNTPFCVTNHNVTATNSLELCSLELCPPLGISSAGVLHISRVTVAMRGTFSTSSGPVSNDNLANCSILNQQGQLCGGARLELFIHLIGKIRIQVT